MSAKSENTHKSSTEIKLSRATAEKGMLEPLLFAHTANEDLAIYQDGELKKAAELAGSALLDQKPTKVSFSIDEDAVTRNGHPVTVLTIINDNKPFLFDSVMNVINELNNTIYLVAHPILDVTEDDNHQLRVMSDTISDTPTQNARRVSVIQIHLQNLTKDEVKKLSEDILIVLDQVTAAVRDWQPMLDEVGKIIISYEKSVPAQYGNRASKAIEFLKWLSDNNFTFLGMRAYDFKKDKDPANAFTAHGTELGILANSSVHILSDSRVEEAPREILSFMESDELLIVTKANSRSMVHRPVWLDYIGVKLFNESGTLTGELRIVGLFTSTAYTSSVTRIPFLKDKAEEVIKRLGYNPKDHSGKGAINVLESYPRDEMFRCDIDTLTKNVSLILELGEHPRLRVLAHADPFGRFVSILTFIPRDRYDTTIREKIGSYYVKAYDGDFFESQPLFIEGALTRVYYIVHRIGRKTAPVIARQTLEENVENITRNWDDSVEYAASQTNSSRDRVALAKKFPDSYRELFDAQTALEDANDILTLSEKNSLKVVFYHHETDTEDGVSLKLFHHGVALALSERVPLLENMGFKVIAEQTIELEDLNGAKIYLHDMQIQNAYHSAVDLSDNGNRLAEAFEAIWFENADDDAFNALTQTAKLNWREIVVLRHYGRYLQQTGIPYSQERLAKTLNDYPAIARDLYALFCLKFDPAKKSKDNQNSEQAIQNRIEQELQTVPSLDDDTIIRRYRNLIEASVRTNAFTSQKDGSPRRILATKLEPRKIDGLPEPRPYREIFVYGPEVEGVHLRFGPVARGGIRWSDRALDYRTEVLGLVKAQQVKNAVIVPVGSKGGFYPHRLPQSSDRAEINEAARQAYILYISAMLSITDNLVDRKVVAPDGIIRHDGNDPYFVVAADKGTATFSDTANAISESYGYWLDDAFASGGSAGYDHKEMGITAKGAWEAVKRHFRELFDKDIQVTPFTCVGVGDMSGDVFGNGMLLSKKTNLIAAFDHRDIFIDPTPDCDQSFEERNRLFNLPRSSWQDYDRSKISKGGGVFSRSLKTITLTPEAAKAIGLDKETATPFEVINAILKADVDLLWFGGIGTYVKASSETNSEVGDRANDAIRISGNELRAKVVGEGANLGMTQRGRIEYSMHNGRCDTDAIDNSAGVNCSDIEVNIKIALASAMQANKLTREARDKLLKEMTPEVSRLVLCNNYLQPLTLSLAENRGTLDLPYQMRFINDLERRKLLDRKVEILPTDQILRDRLAKGQGLTRPELSVVMAYAKLTLEEEITKSNLSNDDYFKTTLQNYFPIQMQEAFATDIENHPLRRDIIATIISNDIINRGGPTFVNRLQDKCGQTIENVVRAYIAVRDGFAVPSLYQELDKLDNLIAGQVQNQFYATVTHMLFATTGWVLRNIDLTAPLSDLVQTIKNARKVIEQQISTLMPAHMQNHLTNIASEYCNKGAPEDLAKRLALLDVATMIPDIALIAKQTKEELGKTAELYFSFVEMFRINRIEEASHAIPVVDYYDGMALSQANDTIAESLRGIVTKVLTSYGNTHNPLQAWLDEEGIKVNDVIDRMSALIDGELNLSRFIFAAGMMANLAINK